MEIITIKKHVSEKDARYSEEENDIYNNSPDKEYMKMCHEVDMMPPATWDKYDMSKEADVKKVVEMEYRELMTAGDKKEQTENICHLSVALLRMWRILNNSK